MSAKLVITVSFSLSSKFIPHSSSSKLCIDEEEPTISGCDAIENRDAEDFLTEFELILIETMRKKLNLRTDQKKINEF